MNGITDNPKEKTGCPSLGCSAVQPQGKNAPAAGGLVYIISAAAMGRGNDDLGWALLQTYLQTICKVKPLPTKMLFYNGGVRLVAEESGALNVLRALQEQGVEILACGTCLDFFNLKAKIQVGRISNMHEIMTAVAEADKVVSPF
ncbi:sulfurtransferase-like selenium metabolism protein YedF [Candidatus Electronema sp. PJ]|uniref:sulfurtransferase-like selenium metabolism protein YedF n=1 Tax=Candidatus Electronema sp. PJ TaxID=3401572 RepID=UPI003AA84092